MGGGKNLHTMWIDCAGLHKFYKLAAFEPVGYFITESVLPVHTCENNQYRVVKVDSCYIDSIPSIAGRWKSAVSGGGFDDFSGVSREAVTHRFFIRERTGGEGYGGQAEALWVQQSHEVAEL